MVPFVHPMTPSDTLERLSNQDAVTKPKKALLWKVIG